MKVYFYLINNIKYRFNRNRILISAINLIDIY